ncbi:hypothetical protein N5I01_002524 [Salmonella enterica]|nr:hypothetical protein [Salmonella enterica]
MSKYELKITGDNKDLKRSTKEAEEMLDNLANKAQGINLGAMGELSNFSGAIMNVGRAGGIAGMAVGAFAGIVLKMADAAVSVTRELRQTSNTIGLTVEQLQKMQGVASKTGFSVEKLGDMHKDLSEKMGAAVLEGGGVSDMIKEAGVNFRELTGILENGGDATDVLARVFYTMKSGGRTMDEIRAVMEDLVSDGSMLIPTFEELKTESNYLNEKAKQTVAVTSEMAKKHEEYEKKTKELGKAIDDLKVQTLTGVVDTLNKILSGLSLFAQELKAGNKYETPKLEGEDAARRDRLLDYFDGKGRAFKNSVYLNKNGPMDRNAFNKLIDHGYNPERYNAHDVTNKEANALRMIEAGLNPLNETARKAFRWMDKEGKERDFKGNLVIRIDGNSTPLGKGAGSGNVSGETKTCSKCGGKEHGKGEKCPVDLAGQAQKRREDALKKLNALDVKLQGQMSASIASQNKQLENSLKDLDEAVNAGIISQKDAAIKRQALIDQNTENVYKMILGADPVDALNALGKLQEIRDNELASHKKLLDNKSISYEEYLRRVNDTEQNYSQIADVTNGLGSFKSNQLSNSFAGASNSPFSVFDALEQEKANELQNYQSEKLRIDGIADLKERHKQMEALTEGHQRRMTAIEKRYSDARMSIADDMYGGFSSAMALFGQENSKAMEAAFIAHRAFAIGQATVNMYTAASDAWKDPTNVTTGQKMAAAAVAVAQNMANISGIKATSISGMAHEGIDNIPREGTWLLDKGERVVDERTNGDLKEFLSNQKSGESNVAPIEVHAPLHIAGNVNSADKMVMDAIKRHAHFVAQAVQDANRRRM